MVYPVYNFPQPFNMTSVSKTHITEEEVGTTYRPKTSAKSVIINRSSTSTRPRSSGIGYGVQQSRMSLGFNPGVYSKMSATGISEFRGSREKEKREMQDCNERLATYIEKVRWLEAQNKKLEAELEALRNRKQEDWKPIRDMYEGELAQARKVITEFSTQRGIGEGKIANLQDQIQALKELCAQYEANQKDYIKKIDQLNSQIGEYEGELTTLRLRCGSLEDELAKCRALVDKLKQENARLRADLDAETAAHIENEVLAQTKTEECEFLEDLLDKLKLMEAEPLKVKGMDAEAFFKGEIRRACQELQQGYEDQLNAMTLEMESRYAAQMDQLRSGNVRESMETEHAKSEVKRLRDQLAEKSARIAELEAALAAMKVERDSYLVQLNELQLEFERERAEKERVIGDLQANLEAMLVQIKELMDHKMSLELEIACYRKLLEGEENRSGLRQLVEQTIGSQGRGASSLAEVVAGQSSMSSTTARTTVQRSSKGAVGFQGADPTGSSVTLENTSSGGRAKSQTLKGWKVTKEVSGKTMAEVPLGEKELKPGQTLVLYAKGSKSTATSDNEIICDFFSWGTGNGTYRLLDDQGQEKANLTMKQQL